MARASAADGVTHIVCTPHANGKFLYDPAVNAGQSSRAPGPSSTPKSIPLTDRPGLRFPPLLRQHPGRQADKTRFSVNGLGYLMVELPDYALPASSTKPSTTSSSPA